MGADPWPKRQWNDSKTGLIRAPSVRRMSRTVPMAATVRLSRCGGTSDMQGQSALDRLGYFIFI